jgi:hypothetical protein
VSITRIEVTWNKPDGTKPAIGFRVSPNAPDRDDEEMQVTKAKAGAQAHFHQKFGAPPPPSELSVQVFRE